MRPVAVIPVAGAGTRLKPLTDRTASVRFGFHAAKFHG